MTERWNHNIQYHPIVRGAVPSGAESALDVGCGEGTLTRALAAAVPRVVGIDEHEPSIELARAAGGGPEYVVGDFLSWDAPEGSFDLVASVAALHHMDAEAALRRMAALVRRGGSVAVIGLALTDRPRELPIDVAGFVASGLHRLRKGVWEQPSPICWPPPYTFPELRRLAERVLPGVRYRRHLMARYTLVWTKP